MFGRWRVGQLATPIVTLVLLVVCCCCGSHDHPIARSCAQQTQRNLYVSTIDGGLTALDERGHTLWTYTANNPLFFSSLESEDIVPSLDGKMYRWDGQKLNHLPFTADDLIDNTHSHSTNSVLVGARATDVVGVNLHTGKRIYECSHERCHRHDNQSLIQRIDVLKLSTSRVTVREARELTGEELWNFTVGNMELMLIEGDDEDSSDSLSCSMYHDMDMELHVDTLLGLVYGTHRSNTQERLWEVKLGAPVVRAWLHEGGKLDPLPLSHPPNQPHPPALMMVHYNNQYYLQPLEYGRAHRGVAATPTHQGVGSLTVGAGGSGDDTGLMVLYSSESFEELCTEGPNGLAVYFYADPLPYDNNSAPGLGVCLDSPGPPEPPADYETTQHWILRKLFSVVKYLLFAIFVLTCNKLHRYLKAHRHRNSSSSSDYIDDEEFPLVDQLVGTIRRHSSLTDTAATPIAHTPSTPSGSTETLVSFTRNDSLPEPRVLPRFGSDYELKGRLGKGGFGVVYHVQNKTDGGEYAVKRIKLPAHKAARDKVMREVRALAQLDHLHIVRYFNSWVEKAPSGWDEMEEWMPLSRRPSYVKEHVSSSVITTSSGSSLSTAPPTATPSRPGGHISPCPSFTNLSHSTIHSVLPPPLTTDSRSSSFVIEFKDDSVDSVETPCKVPPHLSNGLHLSTSSPLHLTNTSGNSRPPALEVTGSSSHLRETDDFSIADCNTGDLANMMLDVSDTGDLTSDGCFSGILLRDRDELSRTDDSYPTEDRDEQRDSVAALAVEPPTYLFIQMQLCRKESLKDWLKSNITNRSHGKVLDMFNQILAAVEYIHGKGMMHRDLKPSNIFFSLEGNIKVGDFGLVTSSAYGGLHNSYLTLSGLGAEEHRQHTGNLGSHFYMSPELMAGRKYNHKVDIFSLGVVFFELHYPFSTDMERAKVLEDVRKYKYPSNFKTKLPLQADLVKWLMAQHPNDRPVVQDICDSNKFKQLQDNVLETIPKL